MNEKARDQKFREWVQRQACAICGRFAEYVNGEGRCHAAHVRRANNSGTGTKPLFSCIPLCLQHHMTQHQRGETSLMPKKQWDLLSQQYLQQWVREACV